MRKRTTTFHSLAGAAVLVSGMAAGAAVMPAAAATPGEWETNHNEWGEVIEDTCGVPGLTVRDEGSGDSRDRFVLRGGLPYFEGHSVDTDVLTNLATGESVRVVEQRNDRDIHVTDNGDGTLTTQYLASGVRVMYDQDGNVIDRGAGSVLVEAIWDHAGTPSDPNDDEGPLDIQFQRESGRDIDICARLVETIG